MTSVPYHLEDEDGAKLSLVYANESRSRIQKVEYDRRVSHPPQLEEFKTRTVMEDELSPSLHLLYEATIYSPEYPSDDDTANLSAAEEAYVTTVIDAFNSVRDEWSSDGKRLEWYKEMEIEKIVRVIDEVEYQQEIPTVGGELLSKFISTHPMPNANHRVALSLLETYLSMYDPNFEMPETGVTGEWYDWAEEFVFKSKEIMTLARKKGLLAHLYRHGCEKVVRDGNNAIRINDHDLTVSDEWAYYAEGLHRDESIAFVTMILDKTESPHLLNQQDDGKKSFLNKLTA